MLDLTAGGLAVVILLAPSHDSAKMAARERHVNAVYIFSYLSSLALLFPIPNVFDFSF